MLEAVVLHSPKNDPICIVCVDDDEDVRTELLEFLLGLDLNVRAFSNAKEALADIEADPAVTVLLADLTMPDMDGLELIARVQERRADAVAVEAVILTGRPPFAVIEGRARHVLHKPVRFKPLLDALNDAHEAAVVRRQTSSSAS